MTRRRLWSLCGLLLAASARLAWAGPSDALYDSLTQPGTAQPAELANIQANPQAAALLEPVDKLCRGLINTVTGSLEVPRTIGEIGHRAGWVHGWTTGVVHGLARAGWRTGAGLLEVVSFPVPPYHRLCIRPEFAIGEANLYRGVPLEIAWIAVEPLSAWLSDGPVSTAAAVFTAPMQHPSQPPAAHPPTLP